MVKVVKKDLFNPKAIEMCDMEMKYNNKCADCPKDILDQLWCKNNQVNWNLSKIVKLNEELVVKIGKLIDLFEKRGGNNVG